MKNIILFMASFLLAVTTTLSANSTLFVVSAEDGVNVRDDAMMQTDAKIIDTLEQGVSLRQVSELPIDDKESWGRFIYTKNGVKSLGWIRMDLVTQITYDK